MVSLDENTLRFAWEARSEDRVIFLILTVSSGHQISATTKAKGDIGLAAYSHSCAPEQAKP